jgi:hypothetical protein
MNIQCPIGYGLNKLLLRGSIKLSNKSASKIFTLWHLTPSTILFSFRSGSVHASSARISQNSVYPLTKEHIQQPSTKIINRPRWQDMRAQGIVGMVISHDNQSTIELLLANTWLSHYHRIPTETAPIRRKPETPRKATKPEVQGGTYEPILLTG